MAIIFIKQPVEKTHDLRREFRHEKIGKKFLRHLLVKGLLKPLRGRINPYKVRAGKLPKGFDIHHILPLSGGGNNDLANLCLIERSFHKFLNRRCFDPALRNIKEGDCVEIDIPDLPPVARYRDFSHFVQQVLARPKRQTTFKKIFIHPFSKLFSKNK